MKTISQLLEHLQALSVREAGGDDVRTDLAAARQELEALKASGGQSQPNRLSRFPGAGSSDQVLDALAAGGGVLPDGRIIGNADKFAQQGEGKSLAQVMTKAMAEGSGAAGGFLVPTQVASEVLRLVRARSAVMQMGVTVTDVEKELDINSFATGASASYVKEGEPIPVSVPTVAQTPLLKPKELAALTPVNNRLLRHATTNPDLDAALRQELAEVLSLRADLAFLIGSGADPEPLGITKVGGITAGPNLGANGAVPTYDNLIDTVAALRNKNAPFLRPGWVINPKLLTVLQKIKDGDENYIADSGILTFDRAGTSGTLLGFPWRSTTQVPANIKTGTTENTSLAVFSSDWDSIWVGMDQVLTIEADPGATYTTDGGETWVSAWQSRQTVFRAVTSHDIGLRRPEFVTTLAGLKV